MFRANENTVADNAVTPSGNQLGKRKTRKVVNLQNNTYTTPPLLGPSTLRLKRTLTSQQFGSGDIVSPGSTTTRGIKETEDLRQDFGHTMWQLKQMQAKPTQENSDHAQARNVNGISQGSNRKAHIGNISDNGQKKQQADERLQLMAETMHRRDIDGDKRMVDLMTTVHDLTLGVKAVAGTVPSCPSPVPVALNPANIPSTGTFLPQQPTYKKLFQRQNGTKPDQMKQPKFNFCRITMSS